MTRTPKARALGTELRRAREERKVTTRDLAERIGRNHGEISRWETGDRTPKPEHVAQVLTALGIVGRPFDEIMSLAHDVTAPLWVAASLPAQRQQMATLLELEQTAVMITEVLLSLIPGLLQTRNYANAIMSVGNLPADEATTRVAIRMGRRDAITKDDPLNYTAFIGQAAVYQNIGGKSVMAEQLGYLLKMAEQPHITVRIMPFACGWHPGLDGPFFYIQPADQPAIVHVELRRSSIFLHEEEAVDAYRQALDLIDKMALTPEASARLIIDRRESLS